MTLKFHSRSPLKSLFAAEQFLLFCFPLRGHMVSCFLQRPLQQQQQQQASDLSCRPRPQKHAFLDGECQKCNRCLLAWRMWNPHPARHALTVKTGSSGVALNEPTCSRVWLRGWFTAPQELSRGDFCSKGWDSGACPHLSETYRACEVVLHVCFCTCGKWRTQFYL